MDGLLTVQSEVNGLGLGRQCGSPACSRVSFMAALLAASETINNVKVLKVAGFWSKLDER